MTIKRTETDIYYLHDYIPTRNFPIHSSEEVAMSRMIWDYKDGENEAFNNFTNEIMSAIAEISRNMVSNRIGLVAVPPSKVNKVSTVRRSIEAIVDWYNQGITKEVFHCDKEIRDYGNLIVRSSDISTAHTGQRATYDEQMESIRCTRSRLSTLWTTFIILDDVTTLGTSMDVCRDILIANGAIDRYIYRMVIARTLEE